MVSSQTLSSSRSLVTFSKNFQPQNRKLNPTYKFPVCRASDDSTNKKLALSLKPRREALMIGTGLAVGLVSGGTQQKKALALENPLVLGNGKMRVFGQATSASSYGGYGGNDQGTDVESFKYWFDVPTTWKSELVTKQEKGYQGVDLRFSDPKNKKIRAFMVTFPGYPTLKTQYEEILNDLSLADSNLQDALMNADEFTYEATKEKDGQLYVDYTIRSEPESLLARITVYNKRLYAMLVWAPAGEFNKQQDTLEDVRASFRNVKQTPEQLEADLRYFRTAMN